MKTQAITIDANVKPSWCCDLYQDTNGNWFSMFKQFDKLGSSTSFSATYTTPDEAVQEALKRMPPKPL